MKTIKLNHRVNPDLKSSREKEKRLTKEHKLLVIGERHSDYEYHFSVTEKKSPEPSY